jgi:formylglycine-generating enzyme required for sulfatase activity
VTESVPEKMRVFLCHAIEDKLKVRELYRHLVRDGFDVWFNEENLMGGQDWKLEIQSAIRKTHVIIFCLSSHSTKKEGFVQAEINEGLEIQKQKPEGTIFIIPLRLDECTPPQSIKDLHWVDLFGKNGYQQLRKSLNSRANQLEGKKSQETKRLPKRYMWTVLFISLLVFTIFLWGSGLLTQKPLLTWDSVPAGEFILGTNDGSTSSQPEQRVYLSAYQITQYEVTNSDYILCVKAHQCQPSNSPQYSNPDYLHHPVVGVNWYDAQDFCKWIGGYLPNEAEWEKAATWDPIKQEKYIWPWGNIWYYGYLNSLENGVRSTVEVGEFPGGASPYGALDMAGNAWEWTNSLFVSYPYDPSDGRESLTAEGQRVVRGGSWANVDLVARPTNRSPFSPDTRSNDLGFRCASASE